MSELTQLEKNIESFLRKFYLSQLIRGLLLGSGSLLFLLSCILAIEYLSYLSTTARSILFFGYVASSALVSFFLVFKPILQYTQVMRRLSLQDTARIIGEKVPGVGDKLTNTLELKSLLKESESELVKAGLKQKAIALEPFDFSAGVQLSDNRSYLKYLFLPLAFSLLIALIWPNAFSEGAKRLVSFNEEFVRPAPFSFQLSNEELVAVEAKDFELRFTMTGEYIPNDVFIEYDDKRFLVQEENGGFVFLFKNLKSSLDFHLSADGFSSKTYSIELLSEPKILGLLIDIDYPDHVGLLDKSISYNGPVRLPSGSKLRFIIKSSGLSQLKVKSEALDTALTPRSNSAQFKLQVFENQKILLQGLSQEGIQSEEIEIELLIIPDESPSIDAAWFPDTVLYKDFYFNGKISDDYGLSKLLFEAQINNKTYLEEIMINPGIPVQEFYHNFSLDSLKLEPGANMSFVFKVYDNDFVRGPKMAQSRSFSLKIPNQDDIRNKEEKENKEALADLKSGMNEISELKDEMKRLREQMLNKKKLDWTDKEAMNKLLKKQKELQNQLNEMSQQQEKMRERREKFSPQDERLIEKQKRIEELMKNLKDERLEKLMEEMEKALENLEKDEAQQKLEDMEKANEDLEKELDRTLELLKQLEFEQKLEESIKQLDKLANDQKDLAKKDDSKSSEQEKLNKDFEKAKEELEKMNEMNEELEKPNELPDDLKEQTEEIKQNMQEGKQKLDNNEKKKAKQKQNQAAQQMEELKDDLNALQQQLQEEKPMEDLNALRRLLENLIQLSFDQEDLIDKVGETSFNDPNFRVLAQKQKSLKDDSKIVADSLFALSKRVAQLAPTVNKEMSLINDNLEKAIKAMANFDIRSTQSRQQYVMTSFNNLALMLDESIQSAQQEMSSKKFGNQSCSKPGQGKKPSAAQMKKKQQSLKQAMEQLQKKMEKGKGPEGEKPGGSKSSMSKELSKLAAEQAAIREQIRQLYESLDKGDKSGGDQLKKIEDLMEQTEKDLINKNLNIETIRRQEDIITRLLESEKAEREREFDKKRSSKEGNYTEERNIFDMEEYKRLKRKESELLRTIPPNLSPYYKKKVSEYFSKWVRKQLCKRPLNYPLHRNHWAK